MKFAKWVAIALFGYVGLVVAFECFLALVQPPGPNTMVIVTTDSGGAENARVVSKLESGGDLYVAANHWPRAWYEEALSNSAVKVRTDGEDRAYTAVPVTGADRDRLNQENPLGFIRFLTGFPPRAFLRLDPS